jgi:hypothetical protein
MWGGGHVTIDRSDLAAASDSATLDLGKGRGVLIGGSPQVDGKGKDHYRLRGVRIQVGLDAHNDVRRVLAQGQGDAVGPDWHLRADTLDIALDSSKVQGALAWGRTHRPDAVTGMYKVVADSLDIRMPGQVMREMWGFGRGRATSRPDSSVREDDWMVGDTLHAEFAPADSARADTARAAAPRRRPAPADTAAAAADTVPRKQELRLLTSRGSARAYYHIVDDAHRDLPPGVNYIAKSRRIAIAMQAGKVATVDVVGGVDGVYLEPVPPRARADSTGAAAADSTRPAGPARTPSPPLPDSTPARPATPPPNATPAPRVRPPAGAPKAAQPERAP